MSEIFDGTNMRRALEEHIPDGETLLAGIHAVSKETNVIGAFEKCVCMEDRLIPDKNGDIIALNKKKYSTYDIYVGITQSFLIIAECERSNYFYQFDDAPDVSEADIQVRYIFVRYRNVLFIGRHSELRNKKGLDGFC